MDLLFFMGVEMNSFALEGVPQAILGINDVIKLTSICRSGIYQKLKTDPNFPRPVRLGKKRMGWRLCDVTGWIDSCPQIVEDAR
jgi:predicted DNA-binding transcriptional regulator AlpA